MAVVYFLLAQSRYDIMPQTLMLKLQLLWKTANVHHKHICPWNNDNDNNISNTRAH